MTSDNSSASQNGSQPPPPPAAPAKRLVDSSKNPDEPFPLPPEELFDAGDETDSKFVSASATLGDIGRALINANDAPGGAFYHLRGAKIIYLWKKEGGTRAGRTTLGKTSKPSGLLQHFAGADFIIWLAADHLRSLNAGQPASRFQVEALLFHELKHIGVEEDEDGPNAGDARLVLVPHELEIFYDEVARYGAWEDSIADAVPAFEQMPLWPDAGHGGEIKKAIEKMQEAVGEGNSMTFSAGGKSATLPGKSKPAAGATAAGATAAAAEARRDRGTN